MLNRDKVIDQAFHDCMKEMYAKAQPSVDYDQLIADFKSGKITEDAKNHIYDRYYLSSEEFSYILDKYVDAYKIKSSWDSHFNLLEEYIQKGGTKDVFKPDWVDNNGDWHPGTRDYEKVPSVENRFKEYFKLVLGEEHPDSSIYAKDLSDIVNDSISCCKNFYCHTREESSFRGGIALGCSPTSNKEKVIEYWKSQGVDIIIEDRNPLLLWDYDYYGNEIDEVMKEEYGDNWEEYWWEKYRQKKEEKEREREIWWNKWQEANQNSLAQNLLND